MWFYLQACPKCHTEALEAVVQEARSLRGGGAKRCRTRPGNPGRRAPERSDDTGEDEHLLDRTEPARKGVHRAKPHGPARGICPVPDFLRKRNVPIDITFPRSSADQEHIEACLEPYEAYLPRFS